MRIDEELKALIPPLTEEEFKQLEENILAEGVRDSLIVWDAPDGDRYIVDGHNRWRIIQKHNLQYNVRRKEFKDRNEVMLWMIDNQLGRRNIDDITRYELGKKKTEHLKEKAEVNRSSGLKQNRFDDINKTDEPINIRKEISKASGLSEDKVGKIQKVEKSAPELLPKVRAGEMTINSAYNFIRAEESPVKTRQQTEREELKAANDRHKAFNESKQEAIVSFSDVKQDRLDSEVIGEQIYDELKSLALKWNYYAGQLQREELQPKLKCMDSGMFGDLDISLNNASRIIRRIRDEIERIVNEK